MKAVVWSVLMIGGLLGGRMPMAGAADEETSPMTSHVASQPAGASSTTSTPAASPAATRTSTTEGSITALNLTAVPPTLQLRDANGKTWPLTVDLKTTTVWNAGRMEKLDQLKVGQTVKIRHAMTGGKELAQSITLEETTKPMSNAGAKTPRY